MQFFRELFSPKNLAGDVRNVLVGLILLGSFSILSGLGAAIIKAIQREPVPWTIFLGVVVTGLLLVVVALVLLKRAGGKQTADEFLSRALGNATTTPKIGAAEFGVIDATVGKDDAGIYFLIRVRNISNVTARDFRTAILIWKQSLIGGYTAVRGFESANPVHPNVTLSNQIRLTFTRSDIEPQFVIFSVASRSSENEPLHEQLFFYRWGGVRNGVCANTLEFAEQEERAKIDARYDVFSKWLAELPNKTPIEAIDECIADGEALEKIFGGLDTPVPDNQPDQWLSDTRFCLRQHAPAYVDRFNAAVKNPGGLQHFPKHDYDWTIFQLADWTKSGRRPGWEILIAGVASLKEIRAKLFSKLP